MIRLPSSGARGLRCAFVIVATLLVSQIAFGADAEPVDFLSFAQGAVPVAAGGAASLLKVDMEQAIAAIDGDNSGYVVTPKPGAPDTEIGFVYRLPAATTFTAFFVPNVTETPSPSQTFFREVEIAGSARGPDGPFARLGHGTLSTHTKKDMRTRIEAIKSEPVLWVKLTLRGGIDVQREQTFFEFSEIIGEGHQQPVPLLETFSGKWKGRGVLLELKQRGASVSGCYDRTGDLLGTVSGNLLRATGKHRTSGVPSTFVLTVTDDGQLTGVRSTNGAPFKLYSGSADPFLATECSERPVQLPGCGDVVHGIQFEYDSVAIRPSSAPVLDALYQGLKDTSSSITIVGHTSSEGSEAYNKALSERRAAAVAAALVERGMTPSGISAHGAGENQPIADNATEAGRSLNRRVEIQCR